jgi:hypothetical protein
MPFTFTGAAVKVNPLAGNDSRLHVLHDGNFCANQHCMYGPRTIRRVVEVVRVDAHQCCACVAQVFGAFACQVYMPLEVLLR